MELRWNGWVRIAWIAAVAVAAAASSGMAAGTKATLTLSDKAVVCNPIKMNGGDALVGTGKDADLVLPFDQLEKVIFTSCQSKACYVDVHHKKEGKFYLQINLDEKNSFTCDVGGSIATMTGKQISSIKAIAF